MAEDPRNAPAALVFLTETDFLSLLRLYELATDGEAHDLPKERMRRLAELGVIRHHSAGRYSLTSFGTWCVGAWPRLPLETVEEANARQRIEMLARNSEARHG